jgi:uncharacterized protein
MKVQVVYALPQRHWLREVELPEGSRAIDAVGASGLLDEVPGLCRDGLQLGIFGHVVQAEAALREGDRVEIYRPLLADPKEVRRRRAARG